MKSILRRLLRLTWRHRKLVAAVGFRLLASALSRRKR